MSAAVSESSMHAAALDMAMHHRRRKSIENEESGGGLRENDNSAVVKQENSKKSVDGNTERNKLAFSITSILNQEQQNQHQQRHSEEERESDIEDDEDDLDDDEDVKVEDEGEGISGEEGEDVDDKKGLLFKQEDDLAGPDGSPLFALNPAASAAMIKVPVAQRPQMATSAAAAAVAAAAAAAAAAGMPPPPPHAPPPPPPPHLAAAAAAAAADYASWLCRPIPGLPGYLPLPSNLLAARLGGE